MTIQVIKQPYEILIRFRDGAISGAHYKTIEIVTDGERTYSAAESQPLPLEGEAVGEALGEALQAALLRIDNLEQQLGSKVAQE